MIEGISTCCECDEVGVTFPKLPELLWWCVVVFGVMGISWLLAADDELFKLLGLMLRVEFWAGELPLPETIKKIKHKHYDGKILYLFFYVTFRDCYECFTLFINIVLIYNVFSHFKAINSHTELRANHTTTCDYSHQTYDDHNNDDDCLLRWANECKCDRATDPLVLCAEKEFYNHFMHLHITLPFSSNFLNHNIFFRIKFKCRLCCGCCL